MSKGLVHTHAGDDSDGKIWGIEGMNLLFMLAALLISIGLALLLSRHQAPTLSVGAGAVPFALVTVYVFAFRQGKPKSLRHRLAGNPGQWLRLDARLPVNPATPLIPHASTQRLVH